MLTVLSLFASLNLGCGAWALPQDDLPATWKWSAKSNLIAVEPTREAMKNNEGMSRAEVKDLFGYKVTYRIPTGSSPAQREAKRAIENEISKAQASFRKAYKEHSDGTFGYKVWHTIKVTWKKSLVTVTSDQDIWPGSGSLSGITRSQQLYVSSRNGLKRVNVADELVDSASRQQLKVICQRAVQASLGKIITDSKLNDFGEDAVSNAVHQLSSAQVKDFLFSVDSRGLSVSVHEYRSKWWVDVPIASDAILGLVKSQSPLFSALSESPGKQAATLAATPGEPRNANPAYIGMAPFSLVGKGEIDVLPNPSTPALYDTYAGRFSVFEADDASPAASGGSVAYNVKGARRTWKDPTLGRSADLVILRTRRPDRILLAALDNPKENTTFHRPEDGPFEASRLTLYSWDGERFNLLLRRVTDPLGLTGKEFLRPADLDGDGNEELVAVEPTEGASFQSLKISGSSVEAYGAFFGFDQKPNGVFYAGVVGIDEKGMPLIVFNHRDRPGISLGYWKPAGVQIVQSFGGTYEILDSEPVARIFRVLDKKFEELRLEPSRR